MTEAKYKFKGRHSNTGDPNMDWVYGNVVEELSTGKMFIVDLSHFDNDTKLGDVAMEVDPKTVTQVMEKKKVIKLRREYRFFGRLERFCSTFVLGVEYSFFRNLIRATRSFRDTPRCSCPGYCSIHMEE